jgi:hypothetical protein
MPPRFLEIADAALALAVVRLRRTYAFNRPKADLAIRKLIG